MSQTTEMKRKALEETAETRKMLGNCGALWHNSNNKTINNYIDYVTQYEPNLDNFFLFSDLYNLGFIEGIRAERAKRNGKTVRKMYVTAYISKKKRRKYERAADNENQD